MLVSVIIPVHNSAEWLDECLESVVRTEYRPLEVSLYNDASTDASEETILKWRPIFQQLNVELIYTPSFRETPGGVGYARNCAVKVSNGSFLCFLDSDDYMRSNRVQIQLELAKQNPKAIVGSNFERIPKGSTENYASWANQLTQEQLYLQQFRECTIIMPTWFMSRDIYDRVGGFDESFTSHIPEDLLFFHRHLDFEGQLCKSLEPLVIYRRRPDSMCSKIPRRALLKPRVAAFERRILPSWTQGFTIWGCGRDGRNFYNTLTDENKKTVKAFCDVNPKKIGTEYHCRETRRRIPIIHFSQAQPPVACCVVMGRGEGELEANIRSVPGLINGQTFWNLV